MVRLNNLTFILWVLRRPSRFLSSSMKCTKLEKISARILIWVNIMIGEKCGKTGDEDSS